MNRFFRYRIDHVLFWVLTVGFYAYTSRTILVVLEVSDYIKDILIRNGLLAVLIYLSLYFVFPLFSNRKRIAARILLLLVLLAGYTALMTWKTYELRETLIAKHADLPETSFTKLELGSLLYYNLSIAVFYVGFVAALYLSKQWYLQRETLRQVQLEKLNTELDYLKAQMNPHFLFNSINTIFFQIDKENTEARETLGKFSDMLRYQLYECNGDTIAIEKEVEYVKNYVTLQQLRKDENYTIEFQSDSLLRGFSIPPLLLIPFIENAFKHVSNYTDKPNRIEIALKKHGEIVALTIINTIDDIASREPGGIGLKNVQRRLALLYPNKHWLTCEKSGDQFSVILKFSIA